MKKTTNIKPEDNGLQLSEARLNIAFEAVWELDALARLLPAIVPKSDDGNYAQHHQVRGITGRILDLTSVLMAVLGDDDLETDRDLRRVVLLKLESPQEVSE